MSRQYDESIQEKFDHGEWYSPVEKIESLSDLIEAMRIRDSLQICVDTKEPDSGHPCFNMLKDQEKTIKEYLTQFGEFDKTTLLSNIYYLLKQNDLRVGELEQILGISSGYISRIAKPGSDKKLSIDIVWKIAQIFGVSLRDLLETDLQIPKSNANMVAKFLIKLHQQTERNEIHWENRGGTVRYLDNDLKELDLFSEEEGGTVVYNAHDHMNPELKFVLADDIYSCASIVPGKELAMIGFSIADKDNSYFCDFVFISKVKQGAKIIYQWEKAFYSSDDRFHVIEDKAEQLMNSVQRQEMDAEISPEVRNIISDYLK